MNSRQVQKFVLRYLEATQCQILEKSPSHVTVRLSPEADKALTNRTYYWSFVERTGVEPETMTYTFLFQPEEEHKPPAGAQPPVADSILGRYFGVSGGPPAGQRIPRDFVGFGSRRLQQLFDIVRERGRFVQLYEEPAAREDRSGLHSCVSWLLVNVKVEFLCDMKREELHSLAISLDNGEIIEDAYSRFVTRKLSPRIPSRVYVGKPQYTLHRAMSMLETRLEKLIKSYDHRWADEAYARWQDEAARVDGYYSGLLGSTPAGGGDGDAAQLAEREAIREQYELRKREIEWQHKPRISVSVVNGGLFHLLR
ncbi:YqhG family protein [Paenibacillus thermoaerophilus]|uniref:YqhG family protein n=1 Tax=Paenibacillus thermoaerophilus TaxID=1215385 RepID=A0ABW2V2E1_9BACL|nr:YqhG family protein [Paenibacillus thermoaerophilus]TMV18855.1 hypothetical protein FE781_02735 [Paenibacillus thermoaerophilus]